MAGMNHFNREAGKIPQEVLEDLALNLDRFEWELAEVMVERAWLRDWKCRDVNMAFTLVFGPLLLDLTLKEKAVRFLRRNLKSLQAGKPAFRGNVLEDSEMEGILISLIQLDQARAWVYERDLTPDQEEDLGRTYQKILKTLLFPLEKREERKELLDRAALAFKRKDLEALEDLEEGLEIKPRNLNRNLLEDLIRVNEKTIEVLLSIKEIKESFPYRVRGLLFSEKFMEIFPGDLSRLSLWYDRRIQALEGQIEEWALEE